MGCPACGGELRQKADLYVCKYCGNAYRECELTVQNTYGAAYSKMSGTALYEYVKDYVVCVRTSIGSGSGFVVSSEGLVITNAHVVLDCTDIDAFYRMLELNTLLKGDMNKIFKQLKKEHPDADLDRIAQAIKTNQGKGYLGLYKYPKSYQVEINGKTYPATLIAHNYPAKEGWEVDLALLYVPGLKGSKAVKIADSGKLRIGQDIYLVGNSKGLGLRMTKGIISDNNRTNLGDFPRIVIDASAQPGNSGGPMFDEKGELCGVLTSGIGDTLNFVLPSNIVKRFISVSLDKNEKISKCKDLHYVHQNDSCFSAYDIKHFVQF